jgi:hypothetical protein
MSAYGHRRGATHAKTSRRRGGDRGNSFAGSSPSGGADGRRAAGDPWIGRPDPPRSGTGPPAHAGDYPSWPGRPGPYALHPDHPSWPGRPDPRWAGGPDPRWPGGPDPRWAATEAALRADDYPSWPTDKFPPWQDAGRPVPGVVQVRPQAAPARPQPLPAPPPAVQLRPGAGPVWDAGSAQLASWIISEANQAAAEIRHEARDQAATSLAGAKRDADQLVRQACDQAAAKLAAAELEAAEIRATVMKLSGELGGMAAYVTQNLMAYAPAPTKPVMPPALQPVTPPALEPVMPPALQPVMPPALEPVAKPEPAARPGTKAAARPKPGPTAARGARSAAKAKTRPRQLVAIRVMTVFAAALFLFALVSGSAEVALHGFRFFVFRAAGTGETAGSGLQEDQGPGQRALPPQR